MQFLKLVFIGALALSYGLLGGGPSLWALGLATPAPVLACAMNGCSCKVDGHKKGQACCCKIGAALKKKFPELGRTQAHGGVSLHAKACGPLDNAQGVSLAPLRPHLAVQSAVFGPASLLRRAPQRSFVRPRLFDAEPLDRPPQA